MPLVPSTQDKKMFLKKQHIPFLVAMTIVVVGSNILVQYPFVHYGLENWITWGAFTYPIAFLVNDLTNRTFGSHVARSVVISGFICAVVFSIALATPRIAIASGAAFLIGQMLDINIFDRLRRKQAWWKAPFAATVFGSALDTCLFFTLAFAPWFAFIDKLFGYSDQSLAFSQAMFGYDFPLWAALGIGDFCVKILIGILALIPYRALFNILKPVPIVH
jgi:queuosine precursor transporter